MRTITSDIPDIGIETWDPNFNVNHFFFEHNCFLKERRFDGKTAGNIINHYCNVFDLNQRYLMVMLQRELGAIRCTDEKNFGLIDAPGYDTLKLQKIDWILCCGVPDDPKDLKLAFKGFENQVAGACATMRRWLNDYKPGCINLLLDKDEKQIYPANASTYSQLRYTPWLSVLTLNAQLYKQYFGDIYS